MHGLLTQANPKGGKEQVQLFGRFRILAFYLSSGIKGESDFPYNSLGNASEVCL